MIPRPQAGDLWGGLVAASLLCLSSGLAGGTRGLISAPTGSLLILLGGTLPVLQGNGNAAALLPMLAVLVMLAGLFQILIGLSGGDGACHAVVAEGAAATAGRHRRTAGEHGDEIVLYELRGKLIFATTDALLDRVSPDLDGGKCVILHLHRVQQVGLTAARLLQQLANRLQRQGGHLLVCNLHHGIGLGELAALQRVLKPHQLEAGSILFASGSPGASLFIVPARGQVIDLTPIC